jgi:mycofactocin system glycosyltransferase
VSSEYRQPRPGHYRLPDSVRLVPQNGGAVAISDYPLRLVRLNSMAAQLLSLCSEECTCAQLAKATNMPVKRVEALCDQLHWKGLLEAGPVLPPPVWPHVSIVIPTYNRAKELERCLYSLFALDYPSHCLEIIVVDDASTDETAGMLQRKVQVAETHDLEMRVVRHAKRQGVGIGRNSGVETAKYDLIANIDSDCVASPAWLKELVPTFQNMRIVAVGGMIQAYDRNTLLGRYEDVCSSMYMGGRPQQLSLKGSLTYVPAANLVIRRTIWQQLGGFAPMSQGEDVDFCRRLLKSGASMNYIPQGVVYHDYRTTWGSFLRIRAAYASAEASLLKRHPDERRVLLLPPEQAMFAAAVIGGTWGITWLILRSLWSGFQGTGTMFALALLPLILALLLTLWGVFKRLQKVRAYGIAIGFSIVLKATLRGQLAYVYLLSKHLTRYYTLPLLVVSLLVPPLFILLLMLCGIVIGVDYVRLRLELGVGGYMLCALLGDCAYEAGVMWGCVKHRTWKPLLPVIRARV